MVEFIGAKTPFQELTIQRGVRLGARPAFPIATPEDVIVLKLLRQSHLLDHRDLDRPRKGGRGWIGSTSNTGAKIWEIGDALASLRARLEQDKQRVKDLFA